MTLNDLKVKESATILSVDATKELRHHFLGELAGILGNSIIEMKTLKK